MSKATQYVTNDAKVCQFFKEWLEGNSIIVAK
jgi:hypothetical protein